MSFKSLISPPPHPWTFDLDLRGGGSTLKKTFVSDSSSFCLKNHRSPPPLLNLFYFQSIQIYRIDWSLLKLWLMGSCTDLENLFQGGPMDWYFFIIIDSLMWPHPTPMNHDSNKLKIYTVPYELHLSRQLDFSLYLHVYSSVKKKMTPIVVSCIQPPGIMIWTNLNLHFTWGWLHTSYSFLAKWLQ